MPTRINDIPSLVDKKYVCYVKDQIGDELFDMFSSQSVLRFNIDGGKEYRNLYDLLLNESVDFNALMDFQKKRFNNLLEKKIIYVDNGYLKICNPGQMLILRYLYYNDVISYWHLTESVRAIVDDMVKEGGLCFLNTLFTKEESDYFNYFLTLVSHKN